MTDVPSPMTDEHYNLLGRIAVAAGRLEYEVALLLGDLIDPDTELSRKVISGMNFDRMLHMAKQLIAIKAPSGWGVVERFDKMSAEADAVMKERNQLLHGRWTIAVTGNDEGDAYPAIRTRTRKGEVTIRMFVDIEELRTIHLRLQDSYTSFQFLYLASLEWSGSFELNEDGSQSRIVPPWRKG